MENINLPVIKNLTTGAAYHGQVRSNRYSLDLDLDTQHGSLALGDLLEYGSDQALVIHKEQISNRFRTLLGVSALPLGKTVTTPSGTTIKCWSAPAGLPADPQSQLLTAAAQGTPLADIDLAITHLIEATKLLPATDQLTKVIKDHIDAHREHQRIVCQPGAGLAVNAVFEITGVPGQLKVLSIDRKSLKNLELVTAAQVPPPVKKSILSALKGE